MNLARDNRFFPHFAFLGTLCGGWVYLGTQCAQRWEKLCFFKQFLGWERQVVKGGEHTPCPRGALSLDLRVAFAKIGKFHRIPPVWGVFGEFAAIFG